LNDSAEREAEKIYGVVSDGDCLTDGRRCRRRFVPSSARTASTITCGGFFIDYDFMSALGSAQNGTGATLNCSCTP